MTRLERLSPFETGVLLSLLLHLLLWQAFAWRGRLAFEGDPDAMEVDLTRPFRLTSDPRLAHRAKVSGTGAPVVAKPTPTPAAAPAVPVAPPKEWVLPGPDT